MKGFTPLRKKIYKMIEESDSPINANTIYKKMNDKPDQSSIYRALNYLEEKGMVKSLTFNTKINYYFTPKKHPHHFLYCKKCGKTESFDICFANKIQKKIEDTHYFNITDHVFYFIGICEDCMKSGEK
ncbi:MAG: transcriptional repressor [Kosmotoga sp.]|nr:MAG: transcriptional repressor [Kosmotoga sp.]